MACGGTSIQRGAKRLGKLIRYIEGSLHQKPRFNEFAEKRPKCSLYRAMVNNCLFFTFSFLFFCGATLCYLAFWDQNDYCNIYA